MGHHVSPPTVEVPRISIAPAKPSDILYVATHMRQADIEEVEASLGVGPVEALVASVSYSPDALTLHLNGKPAAIMGCPNGVVWLLGTDALVENPRLFLKHSRWIWNYVCAGYDTVGNVVYEGNRVHRKWLEWMGCTFHGRPDPNRPFISFTGAGKCVTLSQPRHSKSSGKEQTTLSR